MTNPNVLKIKQQFGHALNPDITDDDQIALYAASEETFFPPGARTSMDNGMVRQAAKPPEFSLDDAQKLVDEMIASPFVQQRWGKVLPVRVVFNTLFDDLFSSGASTVPELREIHLPFDGFGLSRATVVHEFGHMVEWDLAMRENRRPSESGHGIEFAKINLALVEKFMPEKAEAFRERLHFYGMEV